MGKHKAQSNPVPNLSAHPYTIALTGTMYSKYVWTRPIPIPTENYSEVQTSKFVVRQHYGGGRTSSGCSIPTCLCKVVNTHPGRGQLLHTLQSQPTESGPEAINMAQAFVVLMVLVIVCPIVSAFAHRGTLYRVFYLRLLSCCVYICMCCLLPARSRHRLCTFVPRKHPL